jgi:monofunctional biosynthetic peptidoglycan transglycosylase
VALRVVAAVLAVVLVVTVALRWIDPPTTSQMTLRWLTGRGASRHWVSLDDVSPVAIKVLLIAEDVNFCRHHGVDVDALRRAIRENRERGTHYGASTITNQTARSVFLWSHRDVVRKALEYPLSGLTELAWGKHRIMEMYVNVAEFGPGIYGIEEAARTYYGIGAGDLNAPRAARLAVLLPDPAHRTPTRLPADAARRADALARAATSVDGVDGCVR